MTQSTHPPKYREAQRIIAAARPDWASSGSYYFDGLPAESGGDAQFFSLTELARCGAESGGVWCVYVHARRDSTYPSFDFFYVDFGPMTTAARVRYFLDCECEAGATLCRCEVAAASLQNDAPSARNP